MIYRSSEEDILEYENSTAINQSGLKVILKDGIEYFIYQREQLLKQEDIFYKEEKHFVIGSAVDCVITKGDKIFKEKYHCIKLKKKPSPAVMAMVQKVFERVKAEKNEDDILPFISYREHIYNVANEYGYNMLRKAPTEKQLKEEEKRLEAAKEAGAEAKLLTRSTNWALVDTRYTSMKYAEEYWAELVRADGKQILSEEEYNTVNSIVLSFTTHSNTKHLFKDGDDIDILYQLPLYWEMQDTICKGLIDHTFINHSRKIILPLDEKTTGFPITTFNKTIEVRRYDIQGSWYTRGIRENLQRISEIIGKDITDYDIRNFAFLAENTVKPGLPLVFVLSDDLLKVGYQGDGNEKLGWIDALQTYIYWKSINFSLETHFNKTLGVSWVTGDYKIKDFKS